MTRFANILAAVVLVAGLSGCKSSRSSTASGDPLNGRYIPKQDLPLPGRDSAGKSRDPLLASPTSGSKKPTPDEPFRNSKATTTAGLAGHVIVEDTGLSLGDRRTNAEPATRGVPLRPSHETVAVGGESWERNTEELRRLRARYDAPVLDARGEYVMTATVPGAKDGALRRYEASGPSAASAAKQLADQIKSDEDR